MPCNIVLRNELKRGVSTLIVAFTFTWASPSWSGIFTYTGDRRTESHGEKKTTDSESSTVIQAIDIANQSQRPSFYQIVGRGQPRSIIPNPEFNLLLNEACPELSKNPTCLQTASCQGLSSQKDKSSILEKFRLKKQEVYSKLTREPFDPDLSRIYIDQLSKYANSSPSLSKRCLDLINEMRGEMMVDHAMCEAVRDGSLHIRIRMPNPASFSCIAQGYPVKPMQIKSNTASEGHMAGFVPYNPIFSKLGSQIPQDQLSSDPRVVRNAEANHVLTQGTDPLFSKKGLKNDQGQISVTCLASQKIMSHWIRPQEVDRYIKAQEKENMGMICRVSEVLVPRKSPALNSFGKFIQVKGSPDEVLSLYGQRSEVDEKNDLCGDIDMASTAEIKEPAKKGYSRNSLQALKLQDLSDSESDSESDDEYNYSWAQDFDRWEGYSSYSDRESIMRINLAISKFALQRHSRYPIVLHGSAINYLSDHSQIDAKSDPMREYYRECNRKNECQCYIGNITTTQELVSSFNRAVENNYDEPINPYWVLKGNVALNDPDFLKFKGLLKAIDQSKTELRSEIVNFSLVKPSLARTSSHNEFSSTQEDSIKNLVCQALAIYQLHPEGYPDAVSGFMKLLTQVYKDKLKDHLLGHPQLKLSKNHLPLFLNPETKTDTTGELDGSFDHKSILHLMNQCISQE